MTIGTAKENAVRKVGKGLKFVALVITTCTNRKRRPIPLEQQASSLPKGKLPDVARHWMNRLGASAQSYLARDIYGGRAFREASLAGDLLNARLMIVSAGLGLVDADQSVPPYACTILTDVPDSIFRRVTSDCNARAWWEALGRSSPYHRSLESAAHKAGGLICAALSDSYLEMITADILALSEGLRERLRIFTRAPLNKIASDLHRYVMPYDDRLDGLDSPIRGTRGDFAGRALHHFAQYILPANEHGSVTHHAAMVSTVLDGWVMSKRVERRRLDDEAITELIRANWEAEGGRTARLLRRLRDGFNVACEQGRFAGLARAVREERA